jgi:hypothetical protein
MSSAVHQCKKMTTVELGSNIVRIIFGGRRWGLTTTCYNNGKIVDATGITINFCPFCGKKLLKKGE